MRIRFIIKYVLFIVCSCLISMSAQSQDKPHMYYLGKNLNFTTKDSAVFTGLGWEEDGHIKLRCFNILNKTVVFLAYCTDTTLSVFDGLFQSYFPNGDVENEGYYVNGKVNGVWRRWDSFSDLIDSTVYDHGTEVLYAKMNYHPGGNIESVVIDDAKKATIYSTYYSRKGDIIYKDSISTIPGTDSIYIKPGVLPAFPGGQPAWTKYIGAIAHKNRRAIRKDNAAGTCHIRFVVDEEGNISQLEAVTMKGTAMAKILSGAIAAGPKWIPATQNGRKVKSISEIPISYDSSTF